VDIECNLKKVVTILLGNVFGLKNVVMKHMKPLMVLYIGGKINEKKA
tara:strand:+ start:387 stop:527 length:141 start_codon:yes stop_codon:yes gene_type:complete